MKHYIPISTLLILITILFTPALAKKGGVPAHADKDADGVSVTIGAGQVPAPEPSPKKGPPPWAPAHGYRAKYQYRYYPDHRVYYSPERRVWFWLSGDKWRVGASLPLNFDLNKASGYVSLEMGTDKPYQYQADVQKQYPPGWNKKK